jgi:hypothetical protein
LKSDLAAYLPKPAANSEHLVLHVGPSLLPFAVLIILHNLLFARRVTIWLPFCQSHVAAARWHSVGLRWIATLLGVACLAIGLWDIFVARDLWWSVAALMTGFAALYARARMFDGFIYAIDVADDYIRVGGVAEEFARLNAGQGGPLPSADARPKEHTYAVTSVSCAELPSRLPRICARCGEPRVRDVQLSWQHWQGLFPSRATVWLPLCDQHVQTAWWHQCGVPFIVGSLACIFVGITAFAIARDLQWLLLAVLVLAMALFLRARTNDSFVYLIAVADNRIRLGGVSQQFADLNDSVATK